MSDAHLTPTMRSAIAKGREVELQGEEVPRSPQALRADLRTARIQLTIKDKQIAHLKKQIELLKASAPLAEALREEDEPSCP